MAQVKIAIGLFVLLVILGLAGFSYAQYKIIQEKDKEIAKFAAVNEALTEENKRWQTQLADLQNKYDESQNDMLSLSRRIGELSRYNEELKLKYEEYKGRASVVMAKPKLVEKLANKASDKVMEDLSCATGDAVKCGVKK